MVKTLVQQVGMMTSALEHRIPELLFTNEEHPGEAVSAVKALAVAAKEGQRIYTITSENVDSVLPALNVRADVKDDIRDAVAVGKVATVSQNQITVGSWTGVGYIITDPEIGTGAYMISGGSNGGSLNDGIASVLNRVNNFFGMDELGKLIATTVGLFAVIFFLDGFRQIWNTDCAGDALHQLIVIQIVLSLVVFVLGALFIVGGLPLVMNLLFALLFLEIRGQLFDATRQRYHC